METRAPPSSPQRAVTTLTSAESRRAPCRRYSKRIEDEGVLIENFLLVQDGRLREAETRALFASGPHPARDIDRNIADLKAQIASVYARRRGA